MESHEVAIARFKDGAKRIYGDRLKAVILYGSYARGDAHEGSDIDVMLVLDGPVDPYAEIDRLSDLIFDIVLDQKEVIGVVPVTTEDYASLNSPLMLNVRREGVPA